MIRMTAAVDAARFLSSAMAREDVFREIVEKEAKRIDQLYHLTYATWKDKPKFGTQVKANSSCAEATVSTEHKSYYFVHEGVSRLRAVFTTPWRAKTFPGVLGSSTGVGRKLYASKKIDKDSYEPRKFTDAIIKRREPKFLKEAQAALDKFGLRVSKAP